MSRIYDNWEKLVGAVMRRENDRQLVYCNSLNSSSSADLSSRFSFDLHLEDEACRRFEQKKKIFFHSNVMSIEYKEIKKATRNFAQVSVLREGGSGPVYKGWIDDHSLTAVNHGSGIPVAIRKMHYTHYAQHREWVEKINRLGQLGRHPNLVTFVGYSYGTDTWLVHEFMPKGSLAEHLFESGGLLHWATRTKVALGVVRALDFLHYMEIPLNHHNVKSSKIFLDDDFNAKLRDYDLKFEHYLRPGRYSTERDVYSFGVVMVELISGLQALDRRRDAGKRFLMDWATYYLRDETRLWQIMDSKLVGQCPPQEAYEFTKIALRCVNPYLKQSRPTMTDVVAALVKLQHPN